jgi:hypothetical protein
LFDESVVDEVRRAAESSPGSTIGEIACGTSYPNRAALPALMHLLWRQDLTVDITERLWRSTGFWVGPRLMWLSSQSHQSRAALSRTCGSG